MKTDTTNNRRRSRCAGSMTSGIAVVFTALLLLGTAVNQARAAGPIGINMEGLADWSRSHMFTDVVKQSRGWDLNTPGSAGTQNAPVDSNGWPLEDATTICEIVDPAQDDISGTYALSFNGSATVSPAGGGHFTVTNQVYDPVANITTAQVTVPPGDGDLWLQFTNSQRDSASPLNSGVTNVKCIRPGYPADGSQLFSTPWLNSLQPFSVLRCMDIQDTNGQPAFYPTSVTNWSDRITPAFASQSSATYQSHAVCYEYIIQLANQTNKDVWINIPVAATDDYVTQLATLFKNGDTINGVTYPGLNPGLHLYVEYSNEVWNFQFNQAGYNNSAAQAQVASGNSNLNYDGTTDQWTWSTRRVAQRLVQISNAFRAVWGDAAINTTIRPIMAWQISSGGIDTQLQYINDVYGSPNLYIYGVAHAPYYGGPGTDTSSVDSAIAGMYSDCDANVQYLVQDVTSATYFNVKMCAYEGGPGLTGNNNLANIVAANKDPRMTALVEHSLIDNWYAQGGNLYCYFGLCSSFDQYGCWGLTDDINNLNTPKYNGILGAIAAPQPTPVDGIILSTTGTVTFPGDQNHNGIAFLNCPGRIDYLLNSPSDASYSLDIDYNDVNAGGTAYVLVDNALYGVSDLPAGQGTTTPVLLTLSAGLHTLRLFSTCPNGTQQVGLTDVNISSAPSTGPTVPSTPTNLAATAGNGQVSLTWTPTAYTTSYNVKQATVSGGPYTTIATPATPSNTVTGLTNGITYYFVVSAVNSVGESPDSSEASVTPFIPVPPAAPTNLTATGEDAAIALSWTASSGATSYNVQRAATTGGPYSSIGTSTGTYFADTGLTDGVTYYYVVTALNYVGEGSPSNEASATPSSGSGTVIGTVSDPGNGTIDLTAEGTSDWADWAANTATDFIHKATGGSQISNYTVIGGAHPSVDNPNAISVAWSDGNPVVSSTSNNELGGITNIGDGLSITAPADTMPRTIRIYLAAWKSGGQLVAHLSDGSAPDYVDTSVVDTVGGGLNTNRVVAITYHANSSNQTLTLSWTKISGFGGGLGLMAATLQGGSGGTAPPAPTNLAAVAGNAQASLNWNPAGGATSYNVKQSVTTGGPYATVANVTTTNYTALGLTNGVTYYFVVTAVNGVGESPNSNEASVQPFLPKGGSLVGAVADAGTGTIDLTAEGTSDWVDWAATATGDFNRKATGGGQISNYSVIGPNTLNIDNPNNISVTWSDGAPVASATTNNDLGGIKTPGGGIAFTAPADKTSRTLRFYVAAWKSSGQLVAHLSDGSAPDYLDSSVSNTTGGGNNSNSVYTLTYHAATAGQTLTVTWSNVQNFGGGLGILAATLQSATPITPPGPPTMTAKAGHKLVLLTWGQVPGAVHYRIYRSNRKDGVYTQIATVRKDRYTDTDLAGGHRYWYVVTAVNEGGVSPKSVPVSAIPTAK